MRSLLKLKGTTLGIAGIAVAALTKIKETAVSFVQNLLPSSTQKEVSTAAKKPSALAQSSKPPEI